MGNVYIYIDLFCLQEIYHIFFLVSRNHNILLSISHLTFFISLYLNKHNKLKHGAIYFLFCDKKDTFL